MGGFPGRRAMPGIVLFAILAVVARAPARAESLLPNGSFEADASGWLTGAGGTVAVEPHASAPAGASVARVTASSSGSVVLRTQYWLVEATPGVEYAASAWLLDDQPGVQLLVLRLEFVDADGVVVVTGTSTAPFADSSAFQHVASSEVAPAGVAYVSVVIAATMSPAGASFLLDGVTLEATTPPPSSTPTVQPPPTGQPEAPPVVTATPSPTPSATPTPTPTRTPTPTPTSTPSPLAGSLWNADFSGGLFAWDVVRGSGTIEAVLGGSFGESLVLRSDGTAAVWVQQLTLVNPGNWYDASAVLAPLDDVGAAWVRIAWYASTSGAGSQMSTDDSSIVSSAPATGFATTYTQVSTGPVQAPAGAHSARVRILLQPASAAGALAIDDVTFAPAIPPATPTPTPAATPTATATPRATASPTVPATAASTDAPHVAATEVTPAATSPASTSVPAQAFLRISEVMPDPSQDGRDDNYEWLAITNLGVTPATLAGMSLHDNAASTSLPGVDVPPGATIVVAAPQAEVDADIRLDGPIGNGLRNEGDIVELLDATGAVIDLFAWGDHERATFPAPAPGVSLARSFDAAGNAIGAVDRTPVAGGDTGGGHDPGDIGGRYEHRVDRGDFGRGWRTWRRRRAATQRAPAQTVRFARFLVSDHATLDAAQASR